MSPSVSKALKKYHLCRGKFADAVRRLKTLGEVWPGIMVFVVIVSWIFTHKLWVCLVLIPVAVFFMLRRREMGNKAVLGFTTIAVAVSAILGVLFGIPPPDDVLLPANEPIPVVAYPPDLPPYFPQNTVWLHAGNVNIVKSGTNRLSIVSYNGESMLGLQWTPKGPLISGQFFGANGDIVAVLENNRFTTNAENIFQMKKDKHSL